MGWGWLGGVISAQCRWRYICALLEPPSARGINSWLAVVVVVLCLVRTSKSLFVKRCEKKKVLVLKLRLPRAVIYSYMIQGIQDPVSSPSLLMFLVQGGKAPHVV